MVASMYGTVDIPQELLDALRNRGGKGLVLFTGAGLGLYAVSPQGKDRPLPLGSTLANRFLRELGLSPGEGTLSEAAEWVVLENAGTRGRMLELLHGALDPARHRPGPLHWLLGSLPFKCYITTNYDPLLENALDNPRVWSVGEKVDLPDPTRPTVYYLHGRLDDDSVLITDSDFDSRFDRDNRAVVDRVRELLKNHHVLFFGYSLKDRTFRDIHARLDTLLGPHMKHNFALLPGANKWVSKYWDDRHVTVINSNPEDFCCALAERLGIPGTLPNMLNKIAAAEHCSLKEAEQRVDSMSPVYGPQYFKAVVYCRLHNIG